MIGVYVDYISSNLEAKKPQNLKPDSFDLCNEM